MGRMFASNGYNSNSGYDAHVNYQCGNGDRANCLSEDQTMTVPS